MQVIHNHTLCIIKENKTNFQEEKICICLSNSMHNDGVNPVDNPKLH